jgi:hypothetical protein
MRLLFFPMIARWREEALSAPSLGRPHTMPRMRMALEQKMTRATLRREPKRARK